MKIGRALALAAVFGLWTACARQPAAEPIRLEPEQGTMIVRAHVPSLGGQWFILLLPKMIGTRDTVLVNEPDAKPQWLSTGAGGGLASEWAGEAVAYRVELEPAPEWVDIRFTVRNPGRETLPGVWIFTLLSPHGAPDFQDPAMERTWMRVEGRPLALCRAEWRDSPRPDITCFPAAAMRAAGGEPAFLRGLGQTSTTVSDGDWMIGFDHQVASFFALRMPEPLFLFRNREISSLHVAPFLGDIPAGKEMSLSGRAWFGKGGKEKGFALLGAPVEE